MSTRDDMSTSQSTSKSTPEINQTHFDRDIKSIRVWIVDDDDRFRQRLDRALTRRGYTIQSFESVTRALERAHHDLPDVALIDLRLNGEWGLHLVRDLLKLEPALKVIVLTAYGSIATAIEAVQLGALGYLQKPVSISEIERLLKDDPHETGVPQVSEAPDELTLADVEWEHINRILTECDGNIRRAARQLGIHRRTLQRKLAKIPNKR